nr:immunoglobulin heavy chain junction region [Mus musculus]
VQDRVITTGTSMSG